MKNGTRFTHCHQTLIMLFSIGVQLIFAVNLMSQDNYPSYILIGTPTTQSLPPSFQNARNIAITNRIPVDDSLNYANGFEPVRIIGYPGQNDTSYYLIFPDSIGYGFYNVNDPTKPTFFGRLRIPDTLGTRDVESITYSNNSVRIFYLSLQYPNKFGRPTFASLLGCPLSTTNLNKIKQYDQYGKVGAEFSELQNRD